LAAELEQEMRGTSLETWGFCHKKTGCGCAMKMKNDEITMKN